MDEARALIDQTLEYLATTDAAMIDAGASRDVAIELGNAAVLLPPCYRLLHPAPQRGAAW